MSLLVLNKSLLKLYNSNLQVYNSTYVGVYILYV